MSKRVAVYLRHPKGDDYGIHRQLERTRSRAELRGWTVAGEHIDNDASVTGREVRARPAAEC